MNLLSLKFKRVMIFLLLVFIFIQIPLISQNKGIVLDIMSHQTIPFVSIYAKNNEKVLGTMSDENGRFEINFRFNTLFFSHINYSKVEIDIKNISDTIFLLPNDKLLNEVYVTVQQPRWLFTVLNRVVKQRFMNYQKTEKQLGYSYETYCLGDSSGYAFRSNGDLLIPSLSKNKKYSIYASNNIIRYKDKSAGPDFSNLKRMLYSDFIKDFNGKFIGNYNFKENTSFDTNEKNLVQLIFTSKKYQDDKGYIVVDTLNNVIVEFERTSGTNYNQKTQTTTILRNYASTLGFNYNQWNTVFKAKYIKIANSYQLAECKYKLYLKSTLKNKKVNKTSFNSYEAQLFLNTDINSKNINWVSLPKPFYIIGIYTKQMQKEEDLLNKVPISFEDF